MASGKEGNQLYAIAQSTTFSLRNKNLTNNTAILRDHEQPEGQVLDYTVSFTTVPDPNHAGGTVYLVACVLEEYQPPEGYSFLHGPLNVYLVFVDETAEFLYHSGQCGRQPRLFHHDHHRQYVNQHFQPL